MSTRVSYREAHPFAQCSMDEGRKYCRRDAYTGALDADGNVLHRCWSHRDLIAPGKPAVAIVYAEAIGGEALPV